MHHLEKDIEHLFNDFIINIIKNIKCYLIILIKLDFYYNTNIIYIKNFLIKQLPLYINNTNVPNKNI